MHPLLRDHRFLTLTAGHALNGIGSWAGLIAIWGYAAYEFDLGPAQLGLLAAAWGVPPVLLGALAGVVVDRVGARRIAVIADLGNAVVALAMMTADAVSALLLLATLHGIGKAFSGPAYATLPSLVVQPSQLFAANALFTAAADLALVAGPLVAAGVIASSGPAVAFAVDAATYLLAAAATLPLRPRGPAPRWQARSSSARADLAELVRVVRDPSVTPLFVLGFALWLSFGTFIVLEPVFVRDVLQAPVTTFALLQTAFGVGLVATGLTLPLLRRLLESIRAMSVVMALGGGAALAYAGAGAGAVEVAFAASALWGACVALFSAPSRTLLMQCTPAEAHGRVLGAWQAVNNLGQLLPAAAVPLVVGIGVQPVLVAASLLPLGAGLAVAARGRHVSHSADDRRGRRLRRPSNRLRRPSHRPASAGRPARPEPWHDAARMPTTGPRPRPGSAVLVRPRRVR
jgi:predicted MFS family arabinose efflux permease